MCSNLLRSFVNWEESVESTLAEISWIVESSVLVKSVKRLHLVLTEIKAKDIDVFGQSFRLGAFRNDSSTPLNSPSQDNLSWSLSMLGSNLLDNFLFEAGVLFSCSTKLNV